jgi:hypothetical protein
MACTLHRGRGPLSCENKHGRSFSVRNQNPRLRTLPLAANLRVQLRDSCGDPSSDRVALLTKLAANARQEGVYYYTLSVSGGAVQRIQERLAINACRASQASVEPGPSRFHACVGRWAQASCHRPTRTSRRASR